MNSRLLLLMFIFGFAANIRLLAQTELQLVHHQKENQPLNDSISKKNQKKQKKVRCVLAAAGILSVVTVGGIGLWYLLKKRCNSISGVNSESEDNSTSNELDKASSESDADNVSDTDSESDSNSESEDESDMKKKIQNKLSSDLEMFAHCLLARKKINVDVFDFKNEAQKIYQSTETNIEKRKDGWHVIITYKEPNEDSSGRVYRYGYLFEGNYHIEWQLPEKYCKT